MNSELNIKIENLKSVNNPKSIHGLYPYRGKISAIDARSILNQLDHGLLLDPFCGSGTIVYEAAEKGMPTIGVDSNPLAYWITKGKLNLLKSESDFNEEFQNIISKAQAHKKSHPGATPDILKKAFHEKTLNEIRSCLNFFDEMSDYVKAAFFGSIALTARGCNGYMWTSSTVGKDIQPKTYINFYEKFSNKVRKHYTKPQTKSSAHVYHEDSRNLSKFIKQGSVDFIFTSPPYFDALDYTAYYGQIIYELLGLNRIEIKKGLIQNTKTYKEDMQAVFDEIIKITSDNALIIFVVGDKKVKDEIINGGEYFSELLHHKPNLILERGYTGSSSQIFDKLNKTQRKEQIVIWDKKTWK